MKIVIDPGHGGNDTGAEGSSGLCESHVVLAISKLLAEGLTASGIAIKLTRSTDVFIELGDRCAISNAWHADLCVSIHCNSNGHSAKGIETLYTSEDGKQLAEPIQSSLVIATGDIDRGVKLRNDLYILNGTHCVATLVEVGFISHPATEKKLATFDYQALLADAIQRGIGEYLGYQGYVPVPPKP